MHDSDGKRADRSVPLSENGRHVEDDLRASESLKAAILHSALDCIIAITADSRVVEWNPAAERTFGYTRDQAIGANICDLIIPEEYRERHRAGMARYLATGEGPVLNNRVELEALRADGSRFPVELAIDAIEIRGEPHFTAYLRDISDRKKANATLLESEQRMRATYEHAFVGISEVSVDGRFLWCNEELCRITGFDREELLGRTFFEITHEEDRESDLGQFHRLINGELQRYIIEKRYVRKDGSPAWVEISASVVRNQEGEPLYGIRVVKDVSDRKAAERHRELLVNELNHRVKNTLAIVQSITVQSLRSADLERRVADELLARLMALSAAHDILTRENWESAVIKDVILAALAPHQGSGPARFRVSGPNFRIRPGASLSLSMALHELATNAAKYGALGTPEGYVELGWSVDPADVGEWFRLRWSEHGGPPVATPLKRGFGLRMIERGLAAEFAGEVTVLFEPTGLVCNVDAPLEVMAA